jgi:hypothetical protein
MKINCLLKTSEYRGDHSADISVAHEVKENETVLSLCARLLNPIMKQRAKNTGDCLELRIVME